MDITNHLKNHTYCWLVTGVAGFIGSNILKQLLKYNQRVIGVDNFSTGYQRNLDFVQAAEPLAFEKYFTMIEGDVRDYNTCHRAVANVDFVLHQAALGSVPASIRNPLASHEANVTGFLQLLTAARDANVKRFVYASSSAVYGDDPQLPKRESVTGKLLSPYAATKMANELYAEVFASCYDMICMGLRYFNVFGCHQDPDGAYAAVIPKWIKSMIKNETIYINGSGETTRDFTYIDNVIQANLRAALSERPESWNQVYNIAAGERVSLNELFILLKQLISINNVHVRDIKPVHREFREGDILHSFADISKASDLLGYSPSCSLMQGLHESLPWYQEFFNLTEVGELV